MKTTLCMQIFALNMSMCWHQTRYVLLRYVHERVYSRGFYLKVYWNNLSCGKPVKPVYIACSLSCKLISIWKFCTRPSFEKEAKSKLEMAYSDLWPTALSDWTIQLILNDLCLSKRPWGHFLLVWANLHLRVQLVDPTVKSTFKINACFLRSRILNTEATVMQGFSIPHKKQVEMRNMCASCVPLKALMHTDL